MPFSRSVANEIGISWCNQYQRRIGRFCDFFAQNIVRRTID